MPFDCNYYRNRLAFANGDWQVELTARGRALNQAVEAVALEAPHLVREVAEGFLDAGAELLTTPTAGANANCLHDDPRLSSLDVGSLDRLNQQAAKICKETTDGHPAKDRQVLGVVGPCQRLLLLKEIDPSRMMDAYRTQCQALATGGADAIFCRGFVEMEALCVSVRAASETSLPIVATMSFRAVGDQLETALGATPSQACAILKELGVGIFGCEGDVDPQDLEKAIAAIRSQWEGPIWATLPASLPMLDGGRLVYGDKDSDLHDRVSRLGQIGANILAGGKGIGAARIAAWIKAVRVQKRRRR